MSKNLMTQEQIELAKLQLRRKALNFIEGIVLIIFGFCTALFERIYQITGWIYVVSFILVIIGLLSILDS